MTLYILDTDHVSLHQRGHESIKFRLSEVSPNQIAITIITAEELLRGRLAQVHRATKTDERVNAYRLLSETIEYICCFTILKYNHKAESLYQRFRSEKIRIGMQDLKIAAITLSHEAILVTRNHHDFMKVAYLAIEDWS